MDFTEFQIGQNDINRRADKVIKKLLPEENLSGIYKAMRKGLIKINNSKIKPEQLILENDVIKIAEFLLQNHNSSSINKKNLLPLPEIILKTNDLLFLNKPYNTLVQKASKTDLSIDDCVKNYYQTTESETSLSFSPGPLHRLDRNTTGLIAFSWSLNGAHWFSDAIKNHTVQKLYLGIVEGKLVNEQIWQDSISKDFSTNKKFQTVNIKSDKENNAYTVATPIKYGTYNNLPITLVQFNIKTGKTHQIRSQASHHGFPLLGDTAYGAKKQNLTREYFLHAHILIISKDNPLSLPEKILCPLLPDMEDFISKSCYKVKLSL